MITKEYITEYFMAVVEEAFEIFGFEGDDLYALRNTSLNIKIMRAIGTAHQGTGVVTINEAFVGTEDYALLHDTIRHEVAHLVTPTWCKPHGKEWKRNAKLLGAAPKSRHPVSESYKQNCFNYKAFALLEGGEKYYLGGYLRKPSKWCNSRAWAYTIKGKKVNKFIIEKV